MYQFNSNTSFILLSLLAVNAWADTCENNPSKAACLTPLPESQNNPSSMQYWAIRFDYDKDGCLPSAGISNTGAINKGTKASGALNGQCAYSDQMSYANTYYRGFCIDYDGVTNKYCGHIYAQYFVKDQTIGGVNDAFGHRHDWEFGISWNMRTDAGSLELTHASYSAHGGIKTKGVEDIYHQKDADGSDHPYLVYHKDGGGTHAMRFAKFKCDDQNNVCTPEAPENPTGQWVTPTLVNWYTMAGAGEATNQYLKGQLDNADYGKANMPINENHFINNLVEGLPNSYPPADIWQRQFYCISNTSTKEC